MPEAFQEPFSKTDKIELHAISSEEANAVKDKVADKDTDLLVVFPDDFEEAYEAVKNGTSETYPQVKL